MANLSNSNFGLMASLQRLNSELYLDQPVNDESMGSSGSWKHNDGSFSDLTGTSNFPPGFSTASSLDATAAQAASGQADGRLVCPFCGKVFSDRRNFYRHRMVHTNERPFQCPLCQYRSSRKSNVQRHMASRHYPSSMVDSLDAAAVDDLQASTVYHTTSSMDNISQSLDGDGPSNTADQA